MSNSNVSDSTVTNLEVTTNKKSNLETQITVKVPVSTIQGRVEKRINQVAKTAKIDGFRKGKVPVSHIRAQYGAGIPPPTSLTILFSPPPTSPTSALEIKSELALSLVLFYLNKLIVLKFCVECAYLPGFGAMLPWFVAMLPGL